MRTLKSKVGRLIRGLGGPRPMGLPSEAVRWGYRLFLDREAEEGAIQEKRRAFSTPGDLRRYFIDQPEFREQIAPRRVPPLSGVEPPMEIEDVTSEADLHRLFEHIQATWQHLGEDEPHWSVLTSDMFLKNNLENTRQKFYDSGRWDADRFFGSMTRNRIDASKLKTCLELGCGVGRITSWLTKRFDAVVGYDISNAHLQVARSYFEEQGIGNADFRHLTRLDDVRSFPKVDAVFTVIVLQHNPPPIIKMIVEELIRALNPGGVAFFQVPTYYAGYRFSLADYLDNEGAKHEMMEMHVLPQDVVFDIVDREGARVVDVIEDGYTGCRAGEVSYSFLVQKR